jgi:hypothetical protein
MPTTAVSDDDHKQPKSTPPPPAAHCRLTPATSKEELKPLDLSIKATEQPLNLCSKRKRKAPASLSKRHNPQPSKTSTSSPSSTTTPPPPPVIPSSMFAPFYGIAPFFNPTVGNPQEALQQFQNFYSQLQQKLAKNE